MDEMFEPKKKEKLDKSFFKGFVFIFVLGIFLVVGTSYSLEFFKVNKNIGTINLELSNINISVTGDNSIDNTLAKYSDSDGISNGLVKELTITNNNQNHGRVILKINQNSGLDLSSLKYGLIINNVIQKIDIIPNDGIIFDSVIMGNEALNVKVVLWVNSSYSGSNLTFNGTISNEVKRTTSMTSDVLSDNIDFSNITSSNNNYVLFNNESYRIVKIENGRVVICKNSDFDSTATTRVDSGKYNINLSYSDNSIIYSHSTDNKNLYLVKTVDIKEGDGTQENPFVFYNNREYINDKKVIANVTYKEDSTTLFTQPIYYGEANYISYVIDDPGFTNWTDNTNNYNYGDKISVSADKDLTGVVRLTFASKIYKLKSSVSYIASYDDIITSNPTFTTQDQVSSSDTKKTVYYYTGSDALANGNVLFAGYCWQIVRTTDNGGLRIIYNGVAVNNKCETTRTATKGVNATDVGTNQSLSSTTTYGTGYTYDVDNSTFTLTGLMTGKTWSTDYADLIGTYTCLGTDTSCSTLISINSYSNSTTAYVAKYTIGDVAHYSQLGTTPFNANYRSPSMVGYMFNKVKNYAANSAAPSGSIYGKDIEYNNGSYLVIEDTAGVASTNTTMDGDHHYTCGTSGTTSCTTVRFYYYNNYYINLENGETVESVLKEMLNYKQNSSEEDADINNYNSTIKGYLDNWYNQNLNNATYTQYLDDTTVYCNNRSVSNLGSWNKSSTNNATYLQFKQYSANRDLNCENETDRFSVSNTKAELTYPIGLLTEPERYLMADTYAKTGQAYWGLSPYYFNSNAACVSIVGNAGDAGVYNAYSARGARVVLTLAPSVEIEEGSGTYTDPYVVGPKVTRTY